MTATLDNYPPAPQNVPPDITTPSRSYRLRVLVVLASLFLFLVLYIGLIVGSAYLCYFSFSGAAKPARQAPPFNQFNQRRSGDNNVWWVIIGIGSGVLCLFLVKGFFKRQRVDAGPRIEITEVEQPLLFAFIRQLCRDTRAPFPHRVYVSPEVNASVFYHSSLLSLFLPAPKNLLVGLGLVNRLNLSEFKAVLAHEFGHFSQKSMKLGNYVYTSNRIIADLVYGRDWLDDAVAFLRRIDIRIAIFAWGFTGVLWGLRKTLDGAFRAINFANTALSRQMEFNADLVAVSVTGSDALIHALARLDFANEALMQACHDLAAAGDHRLYTCDLFFHQARAADFLRQVRKNPRLGEPPPLPADPAQTAKVFEPGASGIPLMWATHPSNHEREKNAKRRYLRGPLDERPAWVLFTGAAAVRAAVTRHFYQVARQLTNVQLTTPEKVQAFIDDEHAETTYHPRYHGMYDDRFVTPGELAPLVRAARTEFGDPAALAAARSQLYGSDWQARIATFLGRQQEFNFLSALANGQLQLTGKKFTFREGQYDKGSVPGLLKSVDQELAADREWLAAADRQVFVTHYAMARKLDGGQCDDLEDRYRFHLAVQGLLNDLLTHQGNVQWTLNRLGMERQVSQEEFQSALGTFRGAGQALEKCLEAAARLSIPALKNMDAGLPLGTFLLDRPLVRGLSSGEKSLDGTWIQAFLRQLDEVIAKMRRIHYKSLGAILALQESIAGKWTEDV